MDCYRAEARQPGRCCLDAQQSAFTMHSTVSEPACGVAQGETLSKNPASFQLRRYWSRRSWSACWLFRAATWRSTRCSIRWDAAEAPGAQPLLMCNSDRLPSQQQLMFRRLLLRRQCPTLLRCLGATCLHIVSQQEGASLDGVCSANHVVAWRRRLAIIPLAAPACSCSVEPDFGSLIAQCRRTA